MRFSAPPLPARSSSICSVASEAHSSEPVEFGAGMAAVPAATLTIMPPPAALTDIPEIAAAGQSAPIRRRSSVAAYWPSCCQSGVKRVMRPTSFVVAAPRLPSVAGRG